MVVFTSLFVTMTYLTHEKWQLVETEYEVCIYTTTYWYSVVLSTDVLVPPPSTPFFFFFTNTQARNEVGHRCTSTVTGR